MVVTAFYVTKQLFFILLQVVHSKMINF